MFWNTVKKMVYARVNNNERPIYVCMRPYLITRMTKNDTQNVNEEDGYKLATITPKDQKKILQLMQKKRDFPKSRPFHVLKDWKYTIDEIHMSQNGEIVYVMRYTKVHVNAKPAYIKDIRNGLRHNLFYTINQDYHAIDKGGKGGKQKYLRIDFGRTFQVLKSVQ